MVADYQYRDTERFPLTTQEGLTLDKQKLLDAVNYDDLAELLERGETLTEKQEAIRKELREKLGPHPSGLL